MPLKKGSSKKKNKSKSEIIESNFNPHEKTYGGGGTKGLQAVGTVKQGSYIGLQGSSPNLQEENPSDQASDSFYLSTNRKFDKKKWRKTSEGYMRRK